MGMGMTLACDISNPLRNLLWHTPMSVGAKCSWNLTLLCTFGQLSWIPFLRWNSKQFIQMSVHHLNFNSRVQLDQSLQKVGHYIICNGMAQVLPPFKIIARKTFVEAQLSPTWNSSKNLHDPIFGRKNFTHWKCVNRDYFHQQLTAKIHHYQ